MIYFILNVICCTFTSYFFVVYVVRIAVFYRLCRSYCRSLLFAVVCITVFCCF